MTSTLSRLLGLAAILMLAGVPAAWAADEAVGLRQIKVEVPARGASIGLDLWYPAGPGGAPALQGASPLFEGVAVRRDAPVADGDFPLVLLAHGGLRSNPDLAGWIAAALARQGRIVVMPRSPSAEAGPSAPDEVRLRPADLRAALDAVERDAMVASHIASGRASAVGFFLGGTSVLALAGAQIDVAAYRASCNAPARGPDCRWFATTGVDLHSAVHEEAGASQRDPRIGRVVAIDPELVGSLQAASLSSIEVPVTVIALGAAPEAPPPIAGVQAHKIDDAAAFDAFSLCTPRALALLAEEGEDDAICQPGGGRPRAALHGEIAALIEAALAR